MLRLGFRFISRRMETSTFISPFTLDMFARKALRTDIDRVEQRGHSMLAFISQPMANKTKDEILAERKHIVSFLPEGTDVIDTFLDTDDSPLVCLGKSLEMMDKADVVVFAEGWHMSRGCVIEHEAAVRYGKKVEYVSVLSA